MFYICSIYICVMFNFYGLLYGSGQGDLGVLDLVCERNGQSARIISIFGSECINLLT